MANEVPDYSGELEEPQGEELAQLARLAERHRRAQQLVLKREQELAAAQAELQLVSEKLIPELMQELGVKEYSTTDGQRVTVERKLRVSVPVATREACYTWLEVNGLSPLIKRTFTVAFGRDEEAWARRFAADLRRRKREVNVTEERRVESSTLNKALRTLLEEGQVTVPLEMFGAHWQTSTKVERNDRR